MAIKTYIENDKQFWTVTIHVRSKIDRRKRVQKKLSKIPSEKLAIKEEKRLYREACREISVFEGKGLYWENVVDLWFVDLKEGLVNKPKDKSIANYNSMLRLWTSKWNKISVSDLSISDGKDMMRRIINSGNSVSYQKKVKNLINRIFNWGIENRYIEKSIASPVQGLSLGNKVEKIPEILTLEEIKLLLSRAKESGHYWYPIWYMALNTGMRSGELYALRWEHLDFEKNLIMVHEAFDSYSKMIGPTKGRYWRIVPISPSLKSFLIELKANSNEEFVLPRSKTWYHGDQTGPLKDFLRINSIKPVKFHTLRACWATQMLANGISSAIVMRIGGWKRSSTMDIYLRLAGVDVQGATDCLNFDTNSNNTENVINLF